MTTFEKFSLKPETLQALQNLKYTTPTPVQEQAIPLIMEGRDVIALAQTGSGKTAACAIPVCDKIEVPNANIQALVVVPTRELALQFATETQKIGEPRGIKAFAVFGGSDASLQEAKLTSGVHVLIATPGRLIDFIYSRKIDLSHVKILVLDEADEMLSMGFIDDLKFIMDCLMNEHQSLLFSATMSKQIKDLAVKHMKDPIEISLVSEASPSLIEHCFHFCQPYTRQEKLIGFLKKYPIKQSIIFCVSRRQCDEVSQTLKRSIKGVDALHGGMSQSVRTIITSKFRQGKLNHLVATDVAARGLDFSGVSHVFIYELSNDVDVYVHRAGRTGRSGRTGCVITMITKRELSTLKQILKRIDQEVTWIGEKPPFSANMQDNSKGRQQFKRSSSKR